MEHQPRTFQLIEDLLASLAELRRSTRETEATVRRGLKLVRNGADVASALRAVSPADTRQSMNDALKAVEEARHEMRLHIFEIGLQQGLSIGELGRIFGFSRQLAARYAKEARQAVELHSASVPSGTAAGVDPSRVAAVRGE